MAKHYLTLVMGWLCCVAFVLSPGDVSAETFGTIKGRVWNDLNNNHLQDPNEMGMSTVWVQVETSAGGWVNGGYTDMSGEYNFANIPGGGSYRVKIANPANGFNGVTPNEGNDDSIDSDVDIFGFSSVFTLAVGQTMDIDGGFTTGGQCYTPVTATVSNIQCVGGNQFTFQITATGGTAFGGQSWGWNYPAGGLMKQPYGQPVTVGPFSGCNGTVTATISDVDNPFCTATVSAEAPANCCGGPTLTFNCQNNITVTATPGQNGTVVIFNAPTATTTCPGGATTVTQISGPASGSVFPLGTTQVCFKATDNCGNEKTCCFNVTVNPGTSTLTFNCQNNITVTAAPGANGTVVTFNAPTATTTCPGGATTVTQISGPASGSVFPLGTTQVCFKATDNCGNEKTCCFNVTVNPGGGTPDCETITFTPTATNSNTGQITISNLTAPIVLIQVFNSGWAQVFSCVGNCNTPTQVVSGLSVGTYYVKVDYLTANWSPICTKQLYVTIPPGNSCDNVTNGGTIGSDATVCPGNVFVSLSSLSLPTGGTGTIEYQWISSTTGCPTGIGQAITGATSATYSPGSLTQTTWYVRLARRAGCPDWAGASNCVKITVSNLGCGNTTIICPNNINVTAAVNQTTAVVTYPDPQISSTCAGPINVTRISGLASGSAFPVGTTQVCFKATDDCGNEKTCCFTVTVTPQTNITFNCQNNITTTTVTGTAIVYYTAPTATTTCPNGGATVTRISGPASGSAFPVGTTQVCFKATDNCGNEKTCCFTVTVTSCPTPPNTVCFVSPTKPHVSAQITTVDNGSTLTIRTTFSKGFVDNTYGTNAIGWSGGHKFNDLVGSDHVQLALFNGAGTKSLEFKIDYISASNSAPSGYKSLGVLDGEGKMLVGSASSIISATTSLDVNFNQYGYVLTTNSPATNASYTPNPTYPNWIYEVWYEVTVSKAAFGASGFGNPVITSVHASPSKTGSNTEVVVPTPCPVTPPPCGAITFVCQPDISVTTTTGSAVVTYTTPTGTTTCPAGGLSVVRTSGPASGSSFPVGTTQVCFQVTDACGNLQNCCFNVVVTTPPPVTDCCNGSKIADITLKYTGQSCSATTHTQDPSKVSCSGNPNGATPVRIVAQNSNGSKKWFDGTVALNSLFTIRAANGGATRLDADTYVKIYSTSGTLLQDIKFHTSCSQPIAPGNQFGAVKIEGIKFENGTTCGNVTIPPVCTVTRTVENSVEKNDGTNCSNGQTYGIWLNAKWPGSSSESSKYFKISGSTFVENVDGTVTMTGLATNNSLSKVKFQVSINFCGRTFVAPSGSPKTADCYNISAGNWYYYTSYCGTLTGQEDAAGAVLKIAKTGPAFQVGVGANLNESSQFGASGWFTVQIQSHPSNKTLTFNSGDINIRLSGAATTAACGPGTVNCPSCTNGGLAQAEGLTFNAFRKGQTADLQWVSRSGQVAANYFVVERSADGHDFTPIKMVNATGNTLETEYHSTNDAQPLKGDNFYRVREVLTDGTERYSSIEKVTMPDTRSLDIYPNPANANKVWMDVSQFEGQAIRITMYNQLGSIAKTFDIAEAPENAVELSIEGLGSGFYGVEVTAANGVRRTVKLVVSRVE